MNEEALRRYLIEIDALHLFKNVSEVIAIFDADGSGTLDNEEIKALADFVRAEKSRLNSLGGGEAMPQPSALEQPRVVRAFLQAQAQLPKLKTAALAPSQNETNAVLVPSQIESKIIHLKNRDADRGLEDYLSCKIDEIRLTASSLQDELLQQQQLVLETQTRAQRLEEVLQQRTFEYEQLLQQGADDIAQLKLDHDMQLQKASQAFAQQVEATQRSLQLKSESDRAILAESQRLENLRQRLEKDQQRLEEQQGKLQVLRRAVQIQESTAETALSSVVNEHANLHAQHLQLNADRNADTIRWQLQQKRQAEVLQRIQANIDAKERQLAEQQFEIEEEINQLHDLTDVFSADFADAQSAISEKLSGSLQDLERGQRNLQEEWIALIEQQQSLAIREHRLQHVITLRVTVQLSHKLIRLSLNAKRNSWRKWIFYVQRCSGKKFKLYVAFRCRLQRLKQAAFAIWRGSSQPSTFNHDVLSNHNRIESFSTFQSMQHEAADREAQLLEKMTELRDMYSSSIQRERQLQKDLNRALTSCEQETLRAGELEQKMLLQSAYIEQHEHEIQQLQQQCDALLAGKCESDEENRLNCKLIEEKDQIILQYRREIQGFQPLWQENQAFLQHLQDQLNAKEKEVDAIRLEYAAADERRLQYRRTEVMTRVVKRLGNRTVARAFGAWAAWMRHSRAEVLAASLQQMHIGFEQQVQDIRQHEIAMLQEQLNAKEKDIDASSLEHAAVQEHQNSETSQQKVTNTDVQQSDLLEMIALLESSLQSKTAELSQQQQLALETESRAQKLEELLQQRNFEYEKLLQQVCVGAESQRLENLRQKPEERQQRTKHVSESLQQLQHDDENLESRSSSRRTSDSSNASPVNNILRTHDQLKPRTASHVQKQPQWNNSKRSHFSSGDQ